MNIKLAIVISLLLSEGVFASSDNCKTEKDFIRLANTARNSSDGVSVVTGVSSLKAEAHNQSFIVTRRMEVKGNLIIKDKAEKGDPRCASQKSHRLLSAH